VFELNFPVSAEAEPVRAACFDGEAGALFHEKVDPFFCASEILIERLNVIAKGCKNKPGIFPHPQTDERIVLLVESRVVTRGMRYAAQPTRNVVAPPVVTAHKYAGFAFALLAHAPGPVAAPVEQDMHPSVIAARDAARF